MPSTSEVSQPAGKFWEVLRPPHRRGDGAERAVQPVTIDADPFHDALHVVAGLAERDHLEAAIAAVNKGPLPEAMLRRLN